MCSVEFSPIGIWKKRRAKAVRHRGSVSGDDLSILSILVISTALDTTFKLVVVGSGARIIYRRKKIMRCKTTNNM